MKVFGVADSDSYVKWGAAVLEGMPAEWTKSIAVLTTPALPSSDQLRDALHGTSFSAGQTPVLGLAALATRIAVENPDVVLLSVRGPVIRVLVRAIHAAGAGRPLLVSGLPGISIPATRKALYYRSQVDLMLLHSAREIREFRALAVEMRLQQSFGLASLPFLPKRRADRTPGADIVFAAQATVPREREDRVRVLEWLAEAARRHPGARVVVKVRAVAGEQQTHAEKYPYEPLLAELDDVPTNLVLAGGPMSGHLDRAAALVTVSSTAAIEAVALGVPVLALEDFGVGPELINTVFIDSGLLGDSSALAVADFRQPRDSWLADNYFHETSAENWIESIREFVQLRVDGLLPLRPQYRGTFGGALRRIWDRKRALGRYDRSASGYLALAVGMPLRRLVVALRSLRGPTPTEPRSLRTNPGP